jgi:hypothetical protein
MPYQAVGMRTEFFPEGDKLEVAVKNGRWALTRLPAGPWCGIAVGAPPSILPWHVFLWPWKNKGFADLIFSSRRAANARVEYKACANNRENLSGSRSTRERSVAVIAIVWFRHFAEAMSFGTTPLGGLMGKREPQIILKTDKRRVPSQSHSLMSPRRPRSALFV